MGAVMTTTNNGGNFTVERVEHALYAALGIPAVKVVFGERESVDIITLTSLNATLGYFAYQEGRSLSDLAALAHEYGEELAPNVEGVAALVRGLPTPTKDVAGLTFKRATKEEAEAGGKPYGELYMKGVGMLATFTSFESAFQYFEERVSQMGYSAGTAIALLQEVLQADLPIARPADETRRPRVAFVSL